MHEASLHDENCFITLTYDDEHLPEHGTLVKRHWQDFMRRWRKQIAPKKVRCYGVGEYGMDYHRPHYHALIFGHMAHDRYAPAGISEANCSHELERVWDKGFSYVGEVTPASASYVAGYVMKKVDQVGRKPKYAVDPETGESHEIEREFSTMSRGGRKKGHFGIGAGWYDRYGEEVERLESVRFGDQDVSPPRYYSELWREKDEAAYELVRLRRLRKNMRLRPTNELMARELIAKARLTQATRRL